MNKYIYIKETGQVAGPLTMDKPAEINWWGGVSYEDIFHNEKWKQEWEDHLTFLPHYDIVGEHSFLDGQILEEGKDIQPEIRPHPDSSAYGTGEPRTSYKTVIVAIPVIPTEKATEILNKTHQRLRSDTPTSLEEKQVQKEHLKEIMKSDEELGLYGEPTDYENTKKLAENVWLFLTDDSMPERKEISKEAFLHEVEAMLITVKEREKKEFEPNVHSTNEASLATLGSSSGNAIEEAADDYACVMVWINKGQDNEQEFYEYISKASFKAGAEWAASQEVKGNATQQGQLSEWQICPKCAGTKTLPVPWNVNQTTGIIQSYCFACNEHGLIAKPIVNNSLSVLKEHQSISYKGFTATLRWSKEDGCYYGKIENASDLISFEGDTEEEAEIAFREAVDDYIVLAIIENKQKPTIEEVLKAEIESNTGYSFENIMATPGTLNEFAHAAKLAMFKYASLQTEQLRHENKTLKEQQRTLHVEVNSDSLAVAYYEKEIAALQQRIKALEEENRSLKESITYQK